MAKATFTQKDIMLWTMRHPNGINHYYLIEKAPFEKQGLKKALHRFGMSRDTVFAHIEDARAELARYPIGDESDGSVGTDNQTDDADEAEEALAE